MNNKDGKAVGAPYIMGDLGPDLSELIKSSHMARLVNSTDSACGEIADNITIAINQELTDLQKTKALLESFDDIFEEFMDHDTVELTNSDNTIFFCFDLDGAFVHMGAVE